MNLTYISKKNISLKKIIQAEIFKDGKERVARKCNWEDNCERIKKRFEKLEKITDFKYFRNDN